MDVYHFVKVLLLWVLLDVFKESAAISCYSCTSSANPIQCSADDTTSPSNALTIRPFCDGSCLYREDNSDGTTSYERRCSVIRRTDQCLQVSATISECYCNTDLCNGNSHAIPLRQNHHLLYIALAFVLFIYLHLL